MHNDSVRTGVCGAPRGELRCELEPGHPGAHAAGFAPGRPGTAWLSPEAEAIVAGTRAAVEELDRVQLVAREPWASHIFPERKADGSPRYLQRDVKRASRPYPCESLEPAADHRPTIEPGSYYLRIAASPGKQGSGRPRWRHFRLCGPCAVAYELADLKPQGWGP